MNLLKYYNLYIIQQIHNLHATFIIHQLKIYNVNKQYVNAYKEVNAVMIIITKKSHYKQQVSKGASVILIISILN